ncbi:hypothetical protein SAMN04488244_104214 [Vibrio hangzhouensis]|uniref:Uncharacterized protein n=1 Tax=Vibrio hangzhouensis TaxID=462991 RepID=A0A1H5VHT2_9VIBR|nr:hypothetical protein SAMN04488244_104214 [Vibrio hangzhouensis]
MFRLLITKVAIVNTATYLPQEHYRLASDSAAFPPTASDQTFWRFSESTLRQPIIWLFQHALMRP